MTVSNKWLDNTSLSMTLNAGKSAGKLERSGSRWGEREGNKVEIAGEEHRLRPKGGLYHHHHQSF